MKQYYFISGLPRSGSTVLASLLNQHPQVYASTTSPVADLISIVADHWPIISQAIVHPNPDQYSNIIQGIINGAYQHIDKPVILDKNRLWPRFGKILYPTINSRVKIIATVRNIPDILASYILLIRKNNHKITYIDQDLIDQKLPINDKNRCKILWEKYITHPYTSLRIGYNSPEVDICFVEYADIVNNSQHTMNKICEFIKITPITVDTNNLQPMDENDEYHGGLTGLHDVRPVMRQTSPPPAQIIGSELTQLYTDMNLHFWKK